MAGTTQARAAGFSYAWQAQSTSGVPTDYASASNNTVTGLTRMPAAQSADLSFPEDDVAQIEGDDGVDGQFNFDSIELLTYTLTVGRSDNSLINTIQGTTAIDLQSTWDMVGLKPKDRDFTDMFHLYTRRAQQGSDSAARYENVIVPLVTMTNLGTAFASREAGAQNYAITSNRVTKTFYGQDLGASAGTKTSMNAFRFYSEFPVTIDVYVEDGTSTSFTASQTPRTGGTHLGWSWDKSGTPATKSITKSTGDFTFTAGTAGDLLIALYEWE